MERVDIGDLKNLDNIDKLADIFCRRLNYEYTNKSISTRLWKQGIRTSIVDNDIKLFVKHKDFHTIYCKINELKLGLERPIINQLLKEHPYLLVIFSDVNHNNWHFVNIKYDDEVRNRRLFRRIVIGPDERLHTAAQRINMLEVINESLTPIELQVRHDASFDIEQVTKDFYERYTDIFHILSEDIAKENPGEDSDREAQIILDRLLFLYFIQKKGWLNNNKRYLYENFIKFWNKDPKGKSFYSDLLVKLFQALSSQEELFKDTIGNVPFLNGGLFEVDPVYSQRPFRLVIRNSTFENIFDDLLERFNFTVREDTPLDMEVAIDPEMLGRIFENLVLKLEKGDDLRKKTGSYYTPRVIVHFMCKESLKECLISECEIEESKIESLFAMNPAEQLTPEEIEELENNISVSHARLLRNFIKGAYILDPAVGSGAFLVGMLHEMVSILKLLDVYEFGQEYIQRPNYDYELKRMLIETSLYGVDIQEQAVRICELRVWLSLVVDYERQKGEDIPPLPNLSYKFRCGNSLIEKLFGHNVELNQLVKTDKGRQLIDEIKKDKEAYFLARDIQEKNGIELSTLAKQCELMELLIKEKQKSLGYQSTIFQETAKERKKREEIEQAKKEYQDLLFLATNTQKKVEAMLKEKLFPPAEDINNLKKKLGISFIWKLDFAEVFKDRDGFDVVIGNPPYVNIRNLAKFLSERDKESLESMYFSANKGYDYYVLFVEKGLSLNRKSGIFCFIMPNKIQATDYAETIREYLLKQTSMCYIVDVSNIRIFKEASVYPNILIIKKIPPQKDSRVSIGTGFNEPEDVTKSNQYFMKKQGDFLQNQKFTLSLMDKFTSNMMSKINTNSQFLTDFCKIHAGTTGFSASKIGKCIIDKTKPVSNELAFIVTGNIDRYIICPGNVRYLKRHYHSPILRYNKNYITAGKWKLFKSPKIVIGGMTKRIEAAYDAVGYALGVSVYALTNFKLNHKFLLALLNSKLLTFIFCAKFKAKHLAGGYLAINKSQLAMLPFKSANDLVRKELIKYVDQITSIYSKYGHTASADTKDKIERFEQQIDKIVYELYDLNDREIALIEENVKS